MRQQFGRLALFASASLVLAACSTTGASPAYPISQPDTPADSALPPPPPYRPEPIPVDPAPMTAPTESVTSQPLPPPAPAPIPEEPPIPQPPPYTPPTYTPPPPPPPVAAPPVIVTTVTGKVVEVDGPAQVHTVKKGDTVDAIAREFEMTRKEVGELNDLDPPYDKLKLGQKVKGPKTKVKAYVVGQGDTLFAISQRFKVTQKALLDANNLKAGASIRANQRIILPKGYKDGGPLRRAVAAPTPAPSRPAAPVPYTPPAAPPAPYTPPPAPIPYTPPAAPYTPPRAATPAPTPAPTTALPPIGARPAAAPMPAPRPPAAAPSAPIIDSTTPPSDADVIAAGRGRFEWPVKGATIAGFGPRGPGGQRSDGLNIRAAAGDPVRAAAAGEVVYAGDQVPEFGNLVLIKHADGWVTAYAHLGRADVKMRQMVVQGQQVGAVGMSGGVSEPQLHFEVRYAPSPKDKARPIDPSLVLPK